jgi:hypothetical protein
MGAESERTMMLLQELAVLKKDDKRRGNSAARRKRRKQIGEEIKQIANEKKQETGVASSQ